MRDERHATVRVIEPAIELTKAVSDDLVLAGTSVDYTFEVTNVGRAPSRPTTSWTTVTLGDVAVRREPGCRLPTLVAKEGGNQDDFLDREPAEVWGYALPGDPIDRTDDERGRGRRGRRQHHRRAGPGEDFATA